MNSNVMLLLTIGVLTGQVEVQHQNPTSKLVAGEERASQKIPTFAGRVTGVSSDGKRLTLEGKPPKPGAPPSRLETQITEATTLNFYGVFRDGIKPTVGYQALARLETDNPQRAVQIDFGNPVPDVSGRIVDVAEDAKSVTVEIYRKKAYPLRRSIQIHDRTRVQYRDVDQNGKHPQVGYQADIWLEGTTNRAIEARFRLIRKSGGKPNPSSKKPAQKNKTKPNKSKSPITKPKGKPSQPQPFPPTKAKKSPKKKPNKPVDADSKKASKRVPQPKPPSRLSSRNPLPVSADIDNQIDQRLLEAKVTASPLADDAEFLRRVTIDIAGRIPTYEETLAFLSSNARDKRQKLIDDLLERSSYGEHFAAIWHELIVPRSGGKPKKGRDAFAIWLAEQFNQNRGWNEIVRDMLTAEGTIRKNAQSGFLMANAENAEPQANLIADATSRLFWGVQLRCAECHDHPFAAWKQEDFWGTAAFFSRVRRGYTDGKNPTGWTITEQTPDATERQYVPKELLAALEPGPVIRIPNGGGTQAGTRVRARFLGGDEVDWNDDGAVSSAIQRVGGRARQPLLCRECGQSSVVALFWERVCQSAR